MGIVYSTEGDYTQALEYYQQSLQLSESFGDKVAVARDLNNIGGIHDDQGNLTLALDYYLRSLKLKEEAGNKPGIAYTLNNIAGVYGTQGSYAQALDYRRAQQWARPDRQGDDPRRN
jgi:tetratricopeptide (TPR) repeat protein